jgi:ferric-dicitrate binding protein FerR (iron transport regulator)
MSDELEPLFRASGRRPEVPEDRMARVREAAREEWARSVRTRTRRRRRLGTALVATAATLLLGTAVLMRRAGATDLASGRSVAQIEGQVGPAWLRAGKPPVRLTAADAVGRGAEIATDDGGRVAIRLASGHSVRVDERTRLRIVDERSIELERGALYVDSWQPGGAPPGSVVIHTAFGSLRDVGTQFEARVVGDSLVVRVREGRVSWVRPDSEVVVESGMEARAGASGAPEVVREVPDPAAWDWIASVVPMLDIEGRTLGEFLQWIARERDLRVEFASTNLADSAPAVRLSGSIEGMTLDQALASVLATCRLEYRIENGVLELHPSAGRT